MRHTKINYRQLLGVFLVALLFSSTSCTDSETKKAALKGADYAEINNLMSAHSWYHAYLRNDLELENIWVSRDGEYAETAMWGQQSGYWLGMDKIWDMYGDSSKGNMPGPQGGFVWHTITTSVVEIAEDRQTAKGIWYTPGIVAEYLEDGSNNSTWMWEKYGVEFVRENGEWKVWKMKVYTDFSVTIGENIGSAQGASMSGIPQGGDAPEGAGAPPAGMEGAPDMGGAPGGAPDMGGAPDGAGAPPAGGGGGGANWDYEYQDPYNGWSSYESYVEMRPRVPEPYTTYSETWSYMEDGE